MVNSKDISETNSLIVAQLTAEKNKTAIPIAKIDQNYREETGERIPYAKLGYPKLVDYLKTVPGVEVIEMYNAHYVNFVGTEDSQHIADLVSKQRSKNPTRNYQRHTRYIKPLSNSYTPRSHVSVTKTNKSVTESILNILRRYSNGLTRAELMHKLNHEYSLNENSMSLNENLKLLGRRIIIKDRYIYDNTRKTSGYGNGSRYHLYDQVDLSQNNNRDSHYSSIYNNNIHHNSTSDELDSHDYIDVGSDQLCVTENDLIHEIKASDCINQHEAATENHIEEYPNIINPSQQNAAYDSSLYSENSENEMHTTNRREYIFAQNKDYVSNVLSKRVRFRLEKLIQSRPQGIWCTELPKLYEEEYKIPLEWTDLGFHRLSDFTAHLSDIFHVVGPQLNGDFKLYNAKEPLPDEKPTKTSKKLTTASLFDVYGDTDIEPVPTSVPASFSKQLCPDDVITIQETVGQVSVTDLRTSSNVDKNEHPMIEVEVVEAYSPSFFWIRLLKNKNKFHKMMKNLGKFYDENYQNYAVPIIMLERGLNIACVFYGKWHRAIIKSVDPSCRVSVLFYDYGTVDKYPSDEIFYLHRSFTALPAQAIPCGLYSVAPHEGHKWPKRIRDWFIQWVCDKSLWANIVEVDTEKNSMLVTLADTSGKDDFFINDWLIDKKMAKVKKVERVDPEDMTLYVDDLCEYYIEENGVVETIIPTTRRPESTGKNSCTIQSSKNMSSLNTRLDLYQYDWKGFKSRVQKKVDECIMLTMRLYHDFVKNDMGTAAHGIIQNIVCESLTDSILNITFSSMDLDPQEIFTEGPYTLAVLNEPNIEQDSDSNKVDGQQLAITHKSIETNNSVTVDKTVSNFLDMNKCLDNELSAAGISSPVSSPMDMETKRSKLENSIKQAANKFAKKQSNNSQQLMDEVSNSFTQSLLDTNPFRRNLLVNSSSMKNISEPPPLPPRPLKIDLNDHLDNEPMNYRQNSSKIVHESSPVMYDLLKDSSKLDHSNKQAEDVSQNNDDSQIINSSSATSTQLFIDYLDRNYSRPSPLANPFDLSQ